MLSASAWQYTARLRCFNLNTILYTLVIEELLFIYFFKFLVKWQMTKRSFQKCLCIYKSTNIKEYGLIKTNNPPQRKKKTCFKEYKVKINFTLHTTCSHHHGSINVGTPIFILLHRLWDQLASVFFHMWSQLSTHAASNRTHAIHCSKKALVNYKFTAKLTLKGSKKCWLKMT